MLFRYSQLMYTPVHKLLVEISILFSLYKKNVKQKSLNANFEFSDKKQ